MSGVGVDLDEVVPVEVLGDILGDLAESLFPEGPRPFPVPSGEPRTPVTSRIRISGGWDGEVVLRMSLPLGQHLAEQLLMLPAGSSGDEEVLDLLGELVNVVGGNVKALLPGSNQLSLPQPRLEDLPPGADGPPSAPHTLVLRWGLEPVQVSLVPDLSPPDPSLETPLDPSPAPSPAPTSGGDDR